MEIAIRRKLAKRKYSFTAHITGKISVKLFQGDGIRSALIRRAKWTAIHRKVMLRRVVCKKKRKKKTKEANKKLKGVFSHAPCYLNSLLLSTFTNQPTLCTINYFFFQMVQNACTLFKITF